MQQTKYQRIRHDKRSKEIFLELEKLFKKYNPTSYSTGCDASHYDLWSIKAVEITAGKGMTSILPGLIIQSKYVGFYYMPVYVDTGDKKICKRNCRPCSGRGLFSIKMGQKRMTPIREALDLGYTLINRLV